MADAATMTIKAVILPEEIQKTLKDLTFEYSLADATEGWYYKLTDVTNTSSNLISTDSFLQFGGSAQGEDTGTAMKTVAVSDSVYVNFDGGSAAHNDTSALEIGPSESWYGKPGCTVEDIHAISALLAKAGTSSNKVQCIVAAIIDDVA
jgi:hypothetical protein